MPGGVGGGGPTTADLVALNPAIPPWDNVQQAVEGLDTAALPDAPSNGVLYGRRDASWEPAATATDLNRYLQLTGGTMTGDLTVNTGFQPAATVRVASSSVATLVLDAFDYADLHFIRSNASEWSLSASYMAAFGGPGFVLRKFSGGAVQFEALRISPTDGAITGRRFLTDAGNPTSDNQLTQKAYVDVVDAELQRQIDLLASGLIYCGAYDAANDRGTFTPTSNIPDGPLPPANIAPPVYRGEYVICTVAGIGRGNAPAVQINVGDQLISAGPGGPAVWQLLPVGAGQVSVTADQVPLNPVIAPWNNVQQAVAGLNSGKVNKAGDTMTGALTATGFTSTADDQGLFTNGGGRFYKATGSGLIIRESNGGQQPQIEDNNATNRRDIIDTQNGDLRYWLKTETPGIAPERLTRNVSSGQVRLAHFANRAGPNKLSISVSGSRGNTNQCFQLDISSQTNLNALAGAGAFCASGLNGINGNSPFMWLRFYRDAAGEGDLVTDVRYDQGLTVNAVMEVATKGQGVTTYAFEAFTPGTLTRESNITQSGPITWTS